MAFLLFTQSFHFFRHDLTYFFNAQSKILMMSSHEVYDNCYYHRTESISIANVCKFTPNPYTSISMQNLNGGLNVLQIPEGKISHITRQLSLQ